MGIFGFCVVFGLEKLCFKVIDEDFVWYWLSVLVCYCYLVVVNELLRLNSKEDRRCFVSDNDFKLKLIEKDLNVFEVFSEGRVSGWKFMWRVIEDLIFFWKFNCFELFKVLWWIFMEKLEVKMRDCEWLGWVVVNKVLKRFFCGSLFDSDGKYSGYLMEFIIYELYSS